MSKIWIDLTDISGWSGNFTGIQRVVYSLALNFYKNNEAKFFTYDEVNRQFYEADFETIIKRFQEGSKATAAQTRNYKSLLYGAYASLPNTIKLAVPGKVKRFVKVGGKHSIRLVKKVAYNKVRAHRNGGSPISFAKDDVVLVFGNNWDRAIFIQDLALQKESSGFKLYQLVYDLIPILGPHLFGQPLFHIYTRYLFEVIAASDGLFCISKSTQNDLTSFCNRVGLKTPPTAVVRLGDKLDKTSSPKPVKALQRKRFIISVGTIEVRKNHILLYYAWKEALRRNIDVPHLVIVGRPGWHTEDVRTALKYDPGISEHISVYENIDDSELRWLYENCAFSIYPSMYEGWGLPIAESLSYGKLCLASNTSSMPEIAGDLIDYFSPYDSGQCLDKVLEYYKDESKLRRKEAEIKKTYKSTDWHQTYEEVKSFLNK